MLSFVMTDLLNSLVQICVLNIEAITRESCPYFISKMFKVFSC